ncbi:hypothetical protein EYF80_044573 [Liparis tanakae]|uniref:Uncharacterized protein n=1 Tax=Liparis tanakae TaxID=230148 RepID=A0A4Z2FWD8_9TELE|nr:hypothetical protein EYF80_044573 [Liparis tanakae]
MAEARLLKDASTAPMAMASAGSLQYGVERRRSSNTCRMMQSAPSSTALATSLPSARVGRGFLIMLSSI